MFNLLIEELPASVVVDGTEYAINWDAKTMIGISVLIENTHVPPDDDDGYRRLATEQLRLFYPVIPANIHGAMARLIEFYTYSNGNDDKPKSGGKEPYEKRSYSFQHDADMIYAAFLQQYPSKRIDQLHWFEFKAMLESLTEDCLFVKAMQYTVR